MPRPDISPHIVHFTKGENFDQAFKRLMQIIDDQKIIGGSKCIKGGYSCICFTEVPLCALKDGLVNPESYRLCSPFGVMFDKSFIYDLGGRPVIYGPDEEFELLPETHQWRHVRYEPTGTPQIDWTWQREWRWKGKNLQFSPENAVIVVPDRKYALCLQVEHEEAQNMMVLQYSQIMDELIAEQYREKFPWRIAVLDE